jgi:hypothetical protein
MNLWIRVEAAAGMSAVIVALFAVGSAAAIPQRARICNSIPGFAKAFNAWGAKHAHYTSPQYKDELSMLERQYKCLYETG